MQIPLARHRESPASALTSSSDSGSRTAAQQLIQVSAVSGDIIVQHYPRVGEEGTQRWLRRRSHRYAVHVRTRVVALAAGEGLQFLEECIQIAFSAQGSRSPVTRLALQLLAHLESLQKRHDLLLEIALLQRNRLKSIKNYYYYKSFYILHQHLNFLWMKVIKLKSSNFFMILRAKSFAIKFTFDLKTRSTGNYICKILIVWSFIYKGNIPLLIPLNFPWLNPNLLIGH